MNYYPDIDDPDVQREQARASVLHTEMLRAQTRLRIALHSLEQEKATLHADVFRHACEDMRCELADSLSWDNVLYDLAHEINLTNWAEWDQCKADGEGYGFFVDVLRACARGDWEQAEASLAQMKDEEERRGFQPWR